MMISSKIIMVLLHKVTESVDDVSKEDQGMTKKEGVLIGIALWHETQS